MREGMWKPAAIGLMALALLSGCGPSSGRPRPGDTVTPKLDVPIKWKAGQPGVIAVRLQAKGTEDSSPRSLDFFGSTNPVANVTFYDGDTQVEAVQVELSHRC